MTKDILKNQPLEAWIPMISNRELQFEKNLRDIITETQTIRYDNVSVVMNDAYGKLIDSMHDQKIPLELVRQNGEHLLETDSRSTLVHIGRAVTTLSKYEKFMFLVRIVDADLPPIARRIFIEFLLAELGHECFSCMLAEYGVDLNHEMKNKEALLPYVAYLNDKKLLEKLWPVNQRVSVDSIVDEYDNLTLLHYAAKGSADKVARFLLEKGANVAATDNIERTPLHYAALSDDSRTAGLLLKAGARLDAIDLCALSPTFYAVLSHSKTMLRYLIKRGANVSESHILLRTPLYIAAITNDVELTLTLKKLGALQFERKRHNGDRFRSNLEERIKQPIMYAVGHRSNVSAMKKLQKKGIGLDEENKNGETLLMLAVEARSNDVARLFLNNVKFVQKFEDVKKWTALHYAAKEDNVDLIEELINAGADINFKDIDGRTPLYIASLHGSFQSVRKLLQLKADVELFDKYLYTPLHAAAQEDDVIVARMLVEHGNASYMAESVYGTIPLFVALESDATVVAGYLSTHEGAIAFVSKNGSTSLHHAAKGNNEMHLEKFDTNRSINRKDYAGKTVLHYAAEYNSLDAIEYLVTKKYFDIEATDKEGRTALFYAVQKNNPEAVKLLVDSKMNIDHKDKKGLTALQLARKEKLLPVVQLLNQYHLKTN